jgi:hypothetical protein
MFYIESAKFASFALAAQVAIIHVRQRGESVKVRNDAGALLADFYPAVDGTVSIAATDYGKEMVGELAR